MSAARFAVLSFLFFLTITLTGCGQNKPGPAGHEAAHEEEPKTAQVTVWGKRFELFIEHRFIVAGQATNFVTHVTEIKTGEARGEGALTYVMKAQSGETQEAKADAPDRPGIYIPKITFPKAGTWSISLRIPTPDAGDVVETLPDFTVYASKEEAEKAPEVEAPEGISFLKEQQWKVLTRIEAVTTRRMVERLRIPGVVVVRPQSKAAVTPPVSGKLLAPASGKIPEIAERVEAGQVLALVQPPVSGADMYTVASAHAQAQLQIRTLETEFAVKFAEVEANAAKQRVALEQARFNLERMKKLTQVEARSKRELDDAEFALRAAEAEMSAAEAMKKAYEGAKGKVGALPKLPDLKEGYPPLEIRSPISGIVTQVAAHIGASVTPESALFTIMDTQKVFIEARVGESDLRALTQSGDALFETPSERGKFTSLAQNGGKMLFIGQEVDPSSRTVPLIYEADNKDGKLRIGMALTLYIETAKSEEAVAVPESAVVDEDGQPTAYVQLSGETFDKRYLTPGIRENGFVQVVSGLKAGEHVVTKGGYAIRLASVSSVIPAHGHAH